MYEKIFKIMNCHFPNGFHDTEDELKKFFKYYLIGIDYEPYIIKTTIFKSYQNILFHKKQDNNKHNLLESDLVCFL